MHSSSRVALLARTLLVAGAALVVTACSGGSSGTGNSPLPNNYGACFPDTQAQLARPTPNSFSGGISSVEIVANGNANTLYQGYAANADLLVSPAGSAPSQGIPTNPLTLVSDTSGPHPYSSDFYYSGNLTQSLPAGITWNVWLNNFNSVCNPQLMGTFST